MFLTFDNSDVFYPKHQYLYLNKESATDFLGIYCETLLEKAEIFIEDIAVNSIPDIPICDSGTVTADLTLIRIWQVIDLFYCF